MAIIILKGTDRKLECKLSLCDKINKMKEEGADPKTPFNISGTVVELGEIRYAIKDEDTDKEISKENRIKSNDEYVSKSLESFRNEVASYVNGGLEKRLQFNLKVAKMYCLALTGEDIEKYKAQLKPIFLEELKTERLIVNPTKYLKIFEVNELNGDKDLTKIDYIIRQSPFRLMEKYLSNVYQELKFIPTRA